MFQIEIEKTSIIPLLFLLYFGAAAIAILTILKFYIFFKMPSALKISICIFTYKICYIEKLKFWLNKNKSSVN